MKAVSVIDDTIRLKVEDAWVLLAYALRYALGRKDGSVFRCIDALIELAPALHYDQLQVLEREVLEYLANAEIMEPEMAGPCDHEAWWRFVSYARQEKVKHVSTK